MNISMDSIQPLEFNTNKSPSLFLKNDNMRLSENESNTQIHYSITDAHKDINTWNFPESFYDFDSNEMAANIDVEYCEAQSSQEDNSKSLDLSAFGFEYTSNLNQQNNYLHPNISFSPNITYPNVDSFGQFILNQRNSFFNGLIKTDSLEGLSSDISLRTQNKFQEIHTLDELARINLFPKTDTLRKVETNSHKNNDCAFLPKTNPKNDWSTVYPRNKRIQIPEVIVMHPLNTRKGSTTQVYEFSDHNASLENNYNTYPTKKNSATVIGTPVNNKQLKRIYDDTLETPCIHISYSEKLAMVLPTINSRSKKNKNHRKQKHSIVSGSDDYIFEVQKHDIDHIDLPEFHIRRCSSKLPSKDKVVQIPKEDFNSSNLSGICKEKQKEYNGQGDLRLFFDSDSADNNQNREETKSCSSLKCSICKKMFKSNRFFTLHKKRCDSQEPKTHNLIKISNITKNKQYKTNSSIYDKNLIEQKDKSNILIMSNNSLVHTPHFDISEKSMEISINNVLENKNVRPLTRSQSRRSRKK